MGQETCVVRYHHVPVASVVVGPEYLLVDLLGYVAQHVLALVGQVESHLGAIADADYLVALLYLLHAAAQRVEVAVLVHLQGPASSLAQQLCLVLAQVHLPQVGLSLEGGEVVEALAVLADDGVTQPAAVRGQAHDSFLQSLELYLKRLGGVGIGLLVVFLLIFLVILLGVLLVLAVLLAVSFLVVLLLVLLLEFLQQGIVLGREAVAVVGVLGQEGQEHIVLAAPRGVASHAVAFALEEDGLAVHHPSGVPAHVSALRDGVYLSALGTHDALVLIGIAAVGDVAQDEPLAVGAPLVAESAVLAVPLATVRNLGHLLRLQVHHLQLRSVLDEGQLLAVGAVLGLAALHLGEVNPSLQLEGGQLGEDALLLDEGGVGEVQVVVAHDAGLEELPVAVSLRGIDDGASVGREVRLGLCACRLRDAARSGILACGDEHLAPNHEGYLLAVAAHHCLARPAREAQVADGGLVVPRQADAQLLRLSPGLLGVYLAVPGEAEQAVAGHAEEAYGMGLEVGNGLRSISLDASALGLAGIDVHAASVALAQEV